MAPIADNLATVKQRLQATALACGRLPETIQLVAVSKGHGETSVRAALVARHTRFGENRVQEAKAKFAALRTKYPGLELHLIGPLQTNKAEEAVRLFDVIEVLDRPNLAEALAKAIAKTGRKPRLFIEVNIAAEHQKAGIAPAALGEFMDYCIKTCRLSISGLMCIPPQGQDPHPHFTQLKKLANQFELPHVSMGMSADFEEAIRCGATELRIGSAIFGKRET